MSIILPVLAIAFAAFCLWLGVRIYNRRERWAKWTAVGLVVVLVYPLSFGPAIWMAARKAKPGAQILEVYRPVAWLLQNAPRPISKFIGEKFISSKLNGRRLIASGETIYFLD